MGSKPSGIESAALPNVLYAVVSEAGLQRAIKSGVLRRPDRGSLQLYVRRRDAESEASHSLLLRVAARVAAANGVTFSKAANGNFTTRRIPLNHASCPNVPESIPGLKRVDAAGGVIVNESGKRVLLLLKREGSAERWVLPKGKRRRQERRRQAARREALEETGLARLEVGEFLVRECYFDKDGRDVVFKEVSYYLMRCPKGKTALKVRKAEGFVGGEWLSFDVAFELTSPVRAHRSLRKARAAVKNGA
jgi:8-oxo-dGTP pyrophosphatase MutT (NUDIX family)